MKKVFAIFVLVLSYDKMSAQTGANTGIRTTNSDSLTEYIIKYALNDLQIIKDGKSYKSSELLSLAKDVTKNIIENPGKNDLKGAYSEYDKITDEIIQIPWDQQYRILRNPYHSVGKSLEKRIQKLDLPEERIYATLHLGYRCYYNTPSWNDYISDAETIAYSQAGYIGQGNCLKEIAQFFENSNLLHQAVDYYIQAYYLNLENYDRNECGEILYKIGDIYASRKDQAYLSNAINFYGYAATEFEAIGNMHAYYISMLSAAWCAQHSHDKSLEYSLSAVAYDAIEYMKNNEVNSKYKRVLFGALGSSFINSFDQRRKLAALQFLQAKFLLDVSEQNLHKESLYEHMYFIGFANAMLQNEEEVHTSFRAVDHYLYTDKDIVSRQTQYLRRAEILSILKDYERGMRLIEASCDTLLTKNIRRVEPDWLLPYAYNTAVKISQQTNDTASEKKYSEKYKLVQKNYIEELNKMSNIQFNYSRTFNKKLIDNLSTDISFLEESIRFLDSQKSELTLSLGMYRDSVLKASYALNRLKKDIYKLHTSNNGLELRNKELREDNLRIIRENKVIYSSLLALLIAGCLFIWWTRKEKRKAIILEQQRLSLLTNAKIHNIRNNYTSFLGLIDNDKFPEVREYAENSAYFYSQALDAEDKSIWTVEMELDLMYKFYEAEKVISSNVDIKHSFEGFDPHITLFIPEVFTVLLHNSIKHAFKGKKEGWLFSIRIKKAGKLLHLEFEDNGVPGDIQDYFTREGSGLKILKNRIENKLTLSKMKHEVDSCIYAEIGNGGKGTIIKIKFPYEIPA